MAGLIRTSGDPPSRTSLAPLSSSGHRLRFPGEAHSQSPTADPPLKSTSRPSRIGLLLLRSRLPPSVCAAGLRLVRSKRRPRPPTPTLVGLHAPSPLRVTRPSVALAGEIL